MGGLRVHATSTILVLAALTCHAVFVPALVANALVGFVYMWRERDALRDEGSALGPWRVRLTYVQNLAINVGVHVVLTAAVLRWRCCKGAADPRLVLLLQACALAALDLPAVYPTASGDLTPYVVAHCAVVLALVWRDALFPRRGQQVEYAG